MTAMDGKVVVITGGTSGIGQVAAESLAAMGARIVLVARSASRAEEAIVRLNRAGPGIAHRYRLADLASLEEIRSVGAQIVSSEPRIDVLINNAGALFNGRKETIDGLEMTFAVNHMAYFALTMSLFDPLTTTPGARIVNTASAAHQGVQLDFDDLQSRRAYKGLGAYARSKLANILFTRELARRLDGAGVTANCLHPGFVATRFGKGAGGLVEAVLPLAKLAAISPEEGAKTLVHLASAPEVEGVTGRYFHQCREVIASAEARDADAAHRLWEASEQLAAA